VRCVHVCVGRQRQRRRARTLSVWWAQPRLLLAVVPVSLCAHLHPAVPRHTPTHANTQARLRSSTCAPRSSCGALALTASTPPRTHHALTRQQQSGTTRCVWLAGVRACVYMWVCVGGCLLP
jgi:hypothetical protein